MKILIADDHELFLKGLEFILTENLPKAEIVSAKDYTEIFSLIEQDACIDLIITDLAMPGAPYLTAIEKIHTLLPETPIIIISAVFDKEILQKTINIGVSGYIPKTASNNLMVSAINLVLAGGMYIPHELLYAPKTESNELDEQIASLKNIDTNTTTKTKKKLTSRQIDILNCIAEGLSNKQIAYKLNLTEGTIKVHITIILKILNVKNRTSAIIEATKQGYITPPTN